VTITSLETDSTPIQLEQADELLAQFTASEALAESMIPLIGRLYRERHVVTSVYGQPVVHRSVTTIMKAHRFVRKIEECALSVEETWPVLQVLMGLSLAPSRVDIGKLAMKYKRSTGKAPVESDPQLIAFVEKEVGAAITDKEGLPFAPQDVVLYGFGRIGRLLTRILIEKTGSGEALRLRAIVVRKKSENDLQKRASLLRRDSIHGSFQGTICVDEDNDLLLINGNVVKVIYANDPSEIDYTQYGIKDALVVDNTGRWRDEASLCRHLEAVGAKRVLLTAPGKGELKNIVYGVNHETLAADDVVVSAASCTTNAITPVLKVLHESYGVEEGHVETVHAYTNDQNLIDNFHKGGRRGRGAALNMVITETGAAKAVGKVFPALSGKLSGNAIRVPTPDVSLAILNLTLKKTVTTEELNEFLRCVSLDSPLRKQIDYSNSSEAVSTDFIGNRRAGIVDAQSTVANGPRAILYIWYDNEYGYSAQVVRLMQAMAGIHYPAFPQEVLPHDSD
jgi:glyceraldehyde 3-phosphate dehydrogenase